MVGRKGSALRRELPAVRDKDRRLWEGQAETRALRAEYEDVTAALDAAAAGLAQAQLLELGTPFARAE